MPLSSCGACGGTRIPGSPGRPHTLSCRSVCVDGGSYEGCFSRATATPSRSVATMSGSGARGQVTSRLPSARRHSPGPDLHHEGLDATVDPNRPPLKTRVLRAPE